jgi:uncharacterized repeat protein (TIGR03847 family)
MSQEFELDAVDFITIGTIGPPGQRVFHLQARQDRNLLTLIIEKEQAAALAESVTNLLEEIEDEHNRATPEANLDALDLALLEPIRPMFRVAQMGLGYDHDNDRMILVVNELVLDEEEDEPRLARLVATRAQMQALAAQAANAVAGGRPICGNCGRPKDPEGHFCPKSNGHRQPVQWG